MVIGVDRFLVATIAQQGATHGVEQVDVGQPAGDRRSGSVLCDDRPAVGDARVLIRSLSTVTL